MKTNFDKLTKEIYEFEKRGDFDKTSKKQLIKWLKKEISNYQKTNNKIVKKNKLIDIIVLVMQIARRDKILLDEAYKVWWKKSRKYLK